MLAADLQFIEACVKMSTTALKLAGYMLVGILQLSQLDAVDNWVIPFSGQVEEW